MAYIYQKQVFPSVSYDYLLEIFEEYKICPRMIRFFGHAMFFMGLEDKVFWSWTTEDNQSVFAERGRKRPPLLTRVDPHTTKRGVSVGPHFLASISRSRLLSRDREICFTRLRVKDARSRRQIQNYKIYSLRYSNFLFISRYFGIGSDYFYFLRLKLSLLDIKILKKKARQTFRPHMGALFSAINSKINSKFL